MKWKDEIVEEVRKAREAYAARFNYDLAGMFKDLKASEVRNNRKLADLRLLEPKPDFAAN